MAHVLWNLLTKPVDRHFRREVLIIKGTSTIMSVSYKVVTYLIITVGIIHISLTPVFFDQFTMKVGWFIGVGLMVIFLGFLNIANWRSNYNLHIRRLCNIANTASIIYGVLNLFVDKDPQSYFVVVLVVYLTFSSFVVSKGCKNNE